MADGWLTHDLLAIVKGVYAAPGEVNTAEKPIAFFNLLDNNSGASLDLDGWSPALPSVENSGVWADSPLDVGRRPLILQESNVTEKMHFTISGASFSDFSKKLMAFNRMVLDARAFHTDDAQIDPVYIAWKAKCGGGNQYALIFNIEADIEYLNTTSPSARVTVSIEREPYWRAIPPGANPKQWTYEYQSSLPYSRDYAGLTSAYTDHLFISSGLVNRSEMQLSGSSYILRSDNCIVIPANLIPGDAPALMYFNMPNASRINAIVGKKTRKITTDSGLGAGTTLQPIAQNDIFNACDGTLGTDATVAADTGASRNVSGTQQRVEVSFATATNQLRWKTPASGHSTINRFIGRWMVFLRCRQSAGTLGDITMYLRVGTTLALDTDGIKLNVVNPPITSGGTGNSTDWGLVYMGVVNIPMFNAKADIYPIVPTIRNSVGLSNAGQNDLVFGLWATRTAGVSLLYVNDLILIPIDEGSFTIETSDGTLGTNGLTYDETGHFTHGTPEISAVNGLPATIGTQLAKLTGTGIQLTPGVENRLYPIRYDASLFSRIADSETYYINIVPRWRGIRDIKNSNG